MARRGKLLRNLLSTLCGIFFMFVLCGIAVGCAHKHKYEECDRAEATCAAEGYVEYKCSCGETYRDPIEKKAHTYDYTNIAWAWSGSEAAGFSATATVSCSVCAAEAEGHNLVYQTGEGVAVKKSTDSALTYAATCEAEGQNTYVATLTANDTTYTTAGTDLKKVPVEKAAHSYNYTNIVWAWSGTEAAGFTATATVTCSNCSQSATGHTHTYNKDSGVSVAKSTDNTLTYPATCMADGQNTYVATLSVNNTTYSTAGSDLKKVPVGKVSHNYNYSEIVWAWSGTATDGFSASATVACSVCTAQTEGHTHTYNKDSGVSVAKSTDSTLTYAATCGSAGQDTYVATLAVGDDTYSTTGSDLKKVPIEKISHVYDYTNIVWGWSGTTEAGFTATATVTCSNCTAEAEGHTHTYNKDSGVSVTKSTDDSLSFEATCGSAGQDTYVATLTVNNTTYSTAGDDLKKVPLGVVSHTYDYTDIAWI